jgi:dipeptidyl aminopeptidase/acylaminoacyl peptidase
LRRLLAIVLTLSFAGTLVGAVPAQTISEDDYQRLVDVHSPAISPDGKHAAVVVSRILWNDDRRTSDLVLVDLANQTQQTLVHDRKGLSDPAFSPDGTQLAFLADEGTGDNAHSEIYVMRLDGGTAQAVTHIKAGVDQFAWRPDSRALVYAASDADPVRQGAERFRDSFIFTTEPIVARKYPQPSHLFGLSLDDGKTTQLTSGPESVATGEAESKLSWSPDGKTIAFTLVPNAILNDQSYSRIALLDVATKSVRPLTGRSSWESDPMFSPDGTHIAYTCSIGDPQINLAEVCVTTPSGGVGTPVSAAIDRPVQDAAWAHDSQSVLLAVPNRGYLALYRAPLAGAPAPINLGGLNISSPLSGAVGPDGEVVFTGSSTKQPAELFAHAAGGATAKLTDFNAALAQLDLASAQRITFPTSAGTQGDGVLYLPPGFRPERKYPMVVFIHGGPTSSSTLSFSFWAQVMAARGWLVLQPNYRGSDDLGLKYQRAVLYDPEDGPGKDIVAAIQAVSARGIVDESRIAVSGWSYGGIMTAWMISKYHIWRAAVSGASVDDWVADYGTADDSLADEDLFHGSPFVGANAAEWRRASAISYVNDVTTPVLILSDVGDNRDSFATSSMYWRALHDNHKDATLRVWPVDGHFPSDPVRTLDVYHYWIDFIAQHFS